jgi:hypothetical protein
MLHTSASAENMILLALCSRSYIHYIHTLQIPEVLTALRVLMATASELDAISPQLTQALEEDKVCTYTRYSRYSLLEHHNMCSCAAHFDVAASSVATVAF